MKFRALINLVIIGLLNIFDIENVHINEDGSVSEFTLSKNRYTLYLYRDKNLKALLCESKNGIYTRYSSSIFDLLKYMNGNNR